MYVCMNKCETCVRARSMVINVGLPPSWILWVVHTSKSVECCSSVVATNLGVPSSSWVPGGISGSGSGSGLYRIRIWSLTSDVCRGLDQRPPPLTAACPSPWLSISSSPTRAAWPPSGARRTAPLAHCSSWTCCWRCSLASSSCPRCGAGVGQVWGRCGAGVGQARGRC